MTKIKLKRKLWFYPHRCPDCGKVLVFTRHHDQVRCRKCGKKEWLTIFGVKGEDVIKK